MGLNIVVVSYFLNYSVVCCLAIFVVSPVFLIFVSSIMILETFRPPLKVIGGLWKTLLKQHWGKEEGFLRAFPCPRLWGILSFSFFFFLLLFGSKAGFSAGACLWGFAESLPSNGEHLLPCFLLSGLTAEIREPVKGVEGGVGGGGLVG